MFGIFNNKKYRVVHETKNIYTLISKERCKGFEQYVNILGVVSPNTYVKEIKDSELDYLYELSYQVKFKNRWYNLHTALNHLAVTEEHYEITLSFLDRQEQKLAEELAFERTDKFYYTKRLYRSDIEALKVIESPQGVFAKQGNKEQILTGKEIDDYLMTIFE